MENDMYEFPKGFNPTTFQVYNDGLRLILTLSSANAYLTMSTVQSPKYVELVDGLAKTKTLETI